MANGLFGGGEGTAASPYIIEDAFDLDAIRTNLNAYYELKNNINLDVEPFNIDEGWLPINNFNGEFNGNGYTIENLFIDRPNTSYVGLFGDLGMLATLKDFAIKNVNILGNGYVGSIAGRLRSESSSRGIFRCSSSGVVEGNHYVGGLVGYFLGQYGYIQDCYSECLVRGDGDYIAGLVGGMYNNSGYSSRQPRLSRCLGLGKVESSNPNANSTVSRFITSIVEDVYFINYSSKPGRGTEITEEELVWLDIANANFNTQHNGDYVWFFNGKDIPRLMYEVIPYSEKPTVLLKTSEGYFTKKSDWINLGEDFSLINPFESGIEWTNLEKTEWWKEFSGEVEILLFSKTDKFKPSVVIVRDKEIIDTEINPSKIEIQSLNPEPIAIENKDLFIEKKIFEDSQMSDLEVVVDSNVSDSMALDVDYSLLMEGNIGTDFSEINQDMSLNIDSNLTEKMELEGERSLLMEGIDTTDATEDAQFFVDVDSNLTESMTLDGERSLLMEGLSTTDNEAEDGIIEVASQKESDEAVEQGLNLIGEATSQLRTAISVNGGRSWWTYDEDDEEWHPMHLENIDFEGMAINLLNSLDYFAYEKLVPNKIYLKDLVIATQASSTLEDRETVFRKLDVEFYENQAAFIKDATLTPDTIHNEYATLTFDVLDLEGDNIYYKVLIKRAGENEYTQVEPNPNEQEWNKRKSEDSILHAYNHPYFNKGLNKIKIVVKDSRGAISENELDLFLIDEKPWIQVSHNQFGVNLVVGDDRMDSVSFKMSVNGETIIGYTDFQPSPVSFKYLWRPGELKTDEPNLVRIEVVDSFGNISVEEFYIDAQYTNIMFMDNAGEFLTDNLGELLRYLDFGAIVSGTITEPKTVKIINETGAAIKNLEIKVLSNQLAEGLEVQISKGLMPFEETDRIKYEGVVPFQGERELYVRIKSKKKVSGVHDFEAVASADTEI